MTTPRWLREQRRWIKACERYPARTITLPPPPPDLSPEFTAAFSHLWAIPEVATFGHLHPTTRARRTR